MLTQTEIDHLFEFCEKHFVRHYDLQAELVDHLANAIEEQMGGQPNLSFEKALDNVYQSFGPTGFGRLISDKRIAAEKQGSKMFWKFFREHLRWPKALLLLLIIAFSYSLFTVDALFFRIFYISVFLLCPLGEMFAVFNFSRTISSTGKKFLTADFSRGSRLFLFLFFVPVYPDMFEKNFPPTSHGMWSILFLSSLLAILAIITIADIQVLLSVKKRLQNDYPLAFSSK